MAKLADALDLGSSTSRYESSSLSVRTMIFDEPAFALLAQNWRSYGVIAASDQVVIKVPKTG